MLAMLQGAMVFSWTVPLVLAAMLAASSVVFWVLVRQWTLQRRWNDLAEWASGNALSFRAEQNADRPEGLRLLGRGPIRVLMSMGNDQMVIVQVEAPPPPLSADGTRTRWNLLIRRLEFAWPDAALRPVSRAISAPDYLPLGKMYGTLPGERFAAYGADRSTALALGESAARGLLPSDIAVVLSGRDLILDFSTRPFDSLTLQRMQAVAEQVLMHLPKLRQ